MRILNYYYKTQNYYSEPIIEHDFLLRCIPLELPEQKNLTMKLTVDPLPTGGNFGMDSFGNRTYTGRLPRPHTEFSYCIEGTVERNDDLIPESTPLPIYSYASALTKPSAFLAEFLETIPTKNDVFAQAREICDAVHQAVQYTAGVTSVHTTADEALHIGKGVCQDYTHIFLALCRMKHIPSRYVNGLPEGEGASHAWAEIWYDGKWHGIDPTRNCLTNESYLKLCTGRDFYYCPIERGVFRGVTAQSQMVYTKVCEQNS